MIIASKMFTYETDFICIWLDNCL